MNSKFIDILRCPRTGSSLQLQVSGTDDDGSIKSGALTSECGTHQYPIINGIPRFVAKEHYTASFGFEWQKWSRVQFEAENAAGKMAGHTKRMFENLTGFSEQDLKGKLVVEFGCGPGRFIDIVRRHGGIAVGLDMSIAVESARENFKHEPDVLIVQGDVLNPPFKKGSFDVGYTIGVLHHTPDPAAGLRKLAEVIKKQGLVACCVYPKGGLYGFPSVAFYRKLHGALKPWLGNKPALGYSYFSAYFLYHLFAAIRKVPRTNRLMYYLEHYLFVNLNLPDVKWRLLDVFDAITPVYASTHTPEEVKAWFDEANCQTVRQMEHSTSFVGVKE